MSHETPATAAPNTRGFVALAEWLGHLNHRRGAPYDERVDLDLVNDDDKQGPFVKHIGLTFSEVAADRVVATWTADSRHHQPFGIVHGGVHASVVETLGSIGSNVWLEERKAEAHAVGVNNSTDFFRAVREGELVSIATAVHQGRSQQVWVVETRDDGGRLVARGQLRTQNVYRDA